jgi:hypothetical protein
VIRAAISDAIQVQQHGVLLWFGDTEVLAPSNDVGPEFSDDLDRSSPGRLPLAVR